MSQIMKSFLGLFLIMFSTFFFTTIFKSQVINFEYLFYNGATILTFITPVLTMRMFSEERKNGTEQLLYTSPRSITSIVLGKFISAVIVVIICELFTLMYFGILSYFGKPHLGTAVVTLIGFLLLAMAYIAFGMFASSITENQIIAAVITMAGFIFMWFMPSFYNGLSQFSLMNVFSTTFPQGIMSLQGVTLFLSFTALFIILTIIVISRRKSVK